MKKGVLVVLVLSLLIFSSMSLVLAGFINGVYRYEEGEYHFEYTWEYFGERNQRCDSSMLADDVRKRCLVFETEACSFNDGYSCTGSLRSEGDCCFGTPISDDEKCFGTACAADDVKICSKFDGDKELKGVCDTNQNRYSDSGDECCYADPENSLMDGACHDNDWGPEWSYSTSDYDPDSPYYSDEDPNRYYSGFVAESCNSVDAVKITIQGLSKRTYLDKNGNEVNYPSDSYVVSLNGLKESLTDWVDVQGFGSYAKFTKGEENGNDRLNEFFDDLGADNVKMSLGNAKWERVGVTSLSQITGSLAPVVPGVSWSSIEIKEGKPWANLHYYPITGEYGSGNPICVDSVVRCKTDDDCDNEYMDEKCDSIHKVCVNKGKHCAPYEGVSEELTCAEGRACSKTNSNDKLSECVVNPPCDADSDCDSNDCLRGACIPEAEGGFGDSPKINYYCLPEGVGDYAGRARCPFGQVCHDVDKVGWPKKVDAPVEVDVKYVELEADCFSVDPLCVEGVGCTIKGSGLAIGETGECTKETEHIDCDPQQMCSSTGYCVDRTCLAIGETGECTKETEHIDCDPQQKCSAEGYCVDRTLFTYYIPAHQLGISEENLANAVGKFVRGIVEGGDQAIGETGECTNPGKWGKEANICDSQQRCSKSGKCVDGRLFADSGEANFKIIAIHDELPEGESSTLASRLAEEAYVVAAIGAGLGTSDDDYYVAAGGFSEEDVRDLQCLDSECEGKSNYPCPGNCFEDSSGSCYCRATPQTGLAIKDVEGISFFGKIIDYIKGIFS
jgi:hypothetical protein